MRKKVNKNIYPLVKVIWRDSNIYRFQDSIEYALDNYTIEVITTIGFLIGYQDKNPIISRDLLNKKIDQRCSVVIPKENIVSLVKIKTKKDLVDINNEQVWSLKSENKPDRGHK